jgi:hypothetical protein
MRELKLGPHELRDGRILHAGLHLASTQEFGLVSGLLQTTTKLFGLVFASDSIRIGSVHVEIAVHSQGRLILQECI